MGAKEWAEGRASGSGKAQKTPGQRKAQALSVKAFKTVRAGYPAEPGQRAATTPQEHKAAGEAHLAAAKSLKENPGTYGFVKADGGHDQTEVRRQSHLQRAAEHAKEAGDAWDESKHPRGPDGKFV